MAYHFWNLKVYSMYGHNRTNFCFLEIQVLIWQGHDIVIWSSQSVKHFYLTDSYWSNLQKCTKSKLRPKIYNNTILLLYVSMWGCIYIIFHRGFCPKVGMCSTYTSTSKLYQIFTQFTKSPQIHFDSHFDKILKIQAKINFLTI